MRRIEYPPSFISKICLNKTLKTDQISRLNPSIICRLKTRNSVIVGAPKSLTVFCKHIDTIIMDFTKNILFLLLYFLIFTGVKWGILMISNTDTGHFILPNGYEILFRALETASRKVRI